MKNKTCNSCYDKKSENDFSSKQAICKSCRAIQATTQNRNNRLEERKIKREQWRAVLEIEKEEFENTFIKEECLPFMKSQTDLFTFCEVPSEIRKHFAGSDFYKKGYMLKPILFTNKIKNTVEVIHIV